jgi:hypothetical protein
MLAVGFDWHAVLACGSWQAALDLCLACFVAVLCMPNRKCCALLQKSMAPRHLVDTRRCRLHSRNRVSQQSAQTADVSPLCVSLPVAAALRPAEAADRGAQEPLCQGGLTKQFLNRMPCQWGQAEWRQRRTVT